MHVIKYASLWNMRAHLTIFSYCAYRVSNYTAYAHTTSVHLASA